MVALMPVMHEHVHQWARRQEQPGQVRDEMGAMLGNNEEAADDGKQNEDLLHSSSDDVSLRLVFLVHRRLLRTANSCSRIKSLLVGPAKQVVTAGQNCFVLNAAIIAH
jgi:hypothetical protein